MHSVVAVVLVVVVMVAVVEEEVGIRWCVGWGARLCGLKDGRENGRVEGCAIDSNSWQGPTTNRPQPSPLYRQFTNAEARLNSQASRIKPGLCSLRLPSTLIVFSWT